MNFAQRLKQIRNQKDISMDEISKKSGIGKATLSRIENGQNLPNLKTLNKIAKALDMNVIELLAVVEFE